MRSTAAFLVLLIAMAGCYNSSQRPQAENDSSTLPAESQPAEDATGESDGATGEADSAESILADALAKVQSGEALLVDVRSDEEWDEAHFESAKHISMDKITEDCVAAFEGIGKEQTVLLH